MTAGFSHPLLSCFLCPGDPCGRSPGISQPHLQGDRKQNEGGGWRQGIGTTQGWAWLCGRLSFDLLFHETLVWKTARGSHLDGAVPPGHLPYNHLPVPLLTPLQLPCSPASGDVQVLEQKRPEPQPEHSWAENVSGMKGMAVATQPD